MGCSRRIRRPEPDPGEQGFIILLLELPFQPRVSNETPRAKSFWRVAPSVLLRDRAIFPAGVFARARAFSSRMSFLVHSRRLEFFLAISSPFLKSVKWG